jgi:hypothetical protein
MVVKAKQWNGFQSNTTYAMFGMFFKGYAHAMFVKSTLCNVCQINTMQCLSKQSYAMFFSNQPYAINSLENQHYTMFV